MVQLEQMAGVQNMLSSSHGIETFAIFNYARLNWTTSNEAGGLNGFGGKQAAVAGFKLRETVLAVQSTVLPDTLMRH
ncbi:hypothetical protein COOONC_07992 [Cooperia oncophora]